MFKSIALINLLSFYFGNKSFRLPMSIITSIDSAIDTIAEISSINNPEDISLSNEIHLQHYERKFSYRRSRKLKRYFTDINSVVINWDDFPRRHELLCEKDLRQIMEQLGHFPYNIVSIAAYIESRPVVAQLYPLSMELNSLQPFPTMFWLTCPLLQAQISDIEKLGWIQKLQEKLNKNNDYKIQMRECHSKYLQERWSLLSDSDKEYVEKSGWKTHLMDIGIAGIKNFDTVKCLHTHYGHYLARPHHGNIIGLWVHNILQTMAKKG